MSEKPMVRHVELIICDRCKRGGHFKKYAQKGSRAYHRCQCGRHLIVIRTVRLKSTKNSV